MTDLVQRTKPLARWGGTATMLSGSSTVLQMKYIWNFSDENMKKSGTSQGQSASELISKKIVELGDWRDA
jgi:hypothetical protein